MVAAQLAAGAKAKRMSANKKRVAFILLSLLSF
jgi:hypothetical protein